MALGSGTSLTIVQIAIIFQIILNLPLVRYAASRWSACRGTEQSQEVQPSVEDSWRTPSRIQSRPGLWRLSQEEIHLQSSSNISTFRETNKMCSTETYQRLVYGEVRLHWDPPPVELLVRNGQRGGTDLNLSPFWKLVKLKHA